MMTKRNARVNELGDKQETISQMPGRPALLSALKAPPHSSPGQRPGFRNQPIAVRPERAQESRFRPFRADDDLWTPHPGRCLVLAFSAPLARRRGRIFKRQKLPHSDLLR